MKTIAIRIAAFCVVQIFMAALLWLGGYDFDQRNFFIAYYAFMSVILGGMAALYPGIGEKP